MGVSSSSLPGSLCLREVLLAGARFAAVREGAGASCTFCRFAAGASEALAEVLFLDLAVSAGVKSNGMASIGSSSATRLRF